MRSGGVAFKAAVRAVALLGGCALAGAAWAGDLRSLTVGTKVADMPATGYFELACGSNGGPPLKKIAGWAEFATCPADAQGLYEVYIEYEDQEEFTARLLEELFDRDEYANLALRSYSGTKVAGHPVILSVLFDKSGVAQAIRVVTDPRAPLQYRRTAYLLRVPIRANFGVSGWDCVKMPLAPGEIPIGETFFKERCDKLVGERRMVIETHLYRRPGQTGIDATGTRADGDFWSSGRWEIWNPGFSIK
jgi:hypothetical protein